MTKSKSTRATRRTAVKSNPVRAWRKFQKVLDEELGRDFLGARSALLTACVALDGKGVDGDISNSLRMHVLLPLERIETMATGRKLRQ